MNKKMKKAQEKGEVLDFGKLFRGYSKKRQEKILKRARYLQAAIALRKLRKELSFSQDKLAKKMSVEREFISRIESGRQNVTLETLYRIAEAANKRFTFAFK